MNPLLLSGLLVGVIALATPLLLRLTGVGWLRAAAVPLSTVLFATAFTLAGNGPLLRPLVAGLAAAQSVVASQPAVVHTPVRESIRSAASFGYDGGFNPAMGPEGPAAGIRLRGLGLRGLPVPGFVTTRDQRVLFVGTRNRFVPWVHRVRGVF